MTLKLAWSVLCEESTVICRTAIIFSCFYLGTEVMCYGDGVNHTAQENSMGVNHTAQENFMASSFQSERISCCLKNVWTVDLCCNEILKVLN